MNILIIGGTRFVGKHLTEQAIQNGHTVTLFNRGTNNIFPELSLIQGDRDKVEDLQKLSEGSWDAVIDTCAYYPRQVEMLKEVLSPETFYIFISTISVYDDPVQAYQTEDSKLMVLDPDTPEVLDGKTYGGFKVLCEKLVNEQFKTNLIVRPTFIVGPDDTTDRFTYWIYRTAQGGKMLTPETLQIPMQFIDVRDLAIWTIKQVEDRTTGIFNLLNDADEVTLESLLRTTKEISKSDAEFVGIDIDFLNSQELNPGQVFPLCVPKEMFGFMQLDNTRAKQTGLSIRPFSETIQDTLDWSRSLDDDYEYKAGLSRTKEDIVLEAWFKSKA